MRWMWIDRITELHPGSRLVAIKNVSMAEDHLHDHFPASTNPPRPALPIMPATLIIEGCAQSAGILIGHARAFKEKVVLAKVSRAAISRDATPGCTLRYTATLERIDDSGASASCAIELLDHAHPTPAFTPIGSVELLFSHLDHNAGAAGSPGRNFPAHNFVFSDQFKTILRTSGFSL